MTDWIDRLPASLAAIPLHAAAAVLGVLVLQRLARHLGLWAYAAIALPGTLAHELAHFGVALLLAAHPRLPRLWPQRTDHGWRLGSVAFRAPWWRAGPIALAPLLLMPASLAWLVAFGDDARGAALALHAWIAGTLLSASLPSRADLRIATRFIAFVAVAGIAGAIAWRWTTA
jgi:hypothetical protein